MAEAEGRIVAVVAAGLPESVDAGSLAEARAAGSAVDAAGLALAQATPRIGEASLAYDRAARAVRRSVALVQRLDCGWTPRGGSDDHGAMVRRQVAREVGERIARHTDGEAAERLFDDLDERLDALEHEGGLDRPARIVIAAICRDLGLPDAAAPAHRAGEAARPGDDPDGLIAASRPLGPRKLAGQGIRSTDGEAPPRRRSPCPARVSARVRASARPRLPTRPWLRPASALPLPDRGDEGEPLLAGSGNRHGAFTGRPAPRLPVSRLRGRRPISQGRNGCPRPPRCPPVSSP